MTHGQPIDKRRTKTPPRTPYRRRMTTTNDNDNVDPNTATRTATAAGRQQEPPARNHHPTPTIVKTTGRRRYSPTPPLIAAQAGSRKQTPAHNHHHHSSYPLSTRITTAAELRSGAAHPQPTVQTTRPIQCTTAQRGTMRQHQHHPPAIRRRRRTDERAGRTGTRYVNPAPILLTYICSLHPTPPPGPQPH